MNREKDLANYALAFFAAASFLLLVFPSTPSLHSVRLLFSYSFYPVLQGARLDYRLRNVPDNVLRLVRADQENRRLKAELAEAGLQAGRADRLEAENERLSSMLALSRGGRWNGTWARVISKSPRDWFGTVFIDKGTDHGVRLHATVLALSGGRPVLAGRVFEVYPSFSKVMLVTSELSSVICRLRNSGHEGMLEGRGSRRLRLGYLQEKAEPRPGDELVTSVGGLLFPPGIPVATVSGTASRDASMNLFAAEAEPAVEPDSLQEIYVVNMDFPAEIRRYSEEGL
ncbi:MAG TPA: rod shape-determining protein MreC [Elusimicrobiales bacterium]|nr:rod shape-determining protein MreC [Elusimicrobiales bacterium]